MDKEHFLKLIELGDLCNNALNGMLHLKAHPENAVLRADTISAIETIAFVLSNKTEDPYKKIVNRLVKLLWFRNAPESLISPAREEWYIASIEKINRHLSLALKDFVFLSRNEAEPLFHYLDGVCNKTDSHYMLTLHACLKGYFACPQSVYEHLTVLILQLEETKRPSSFSEKIWDDFDRLPLKNSRFHNISIKHALREDMDPEKRHLIFKKMAHFYVKGTLLKKKNKTHR